MLFQSLIIASLAVVCLGRPAADPKPPNLTYLFTVNLTLSPPINIGTGPLGNRVFVPLTGGSLAGPKLNGKIAAAGGDWGLFDASKAFSPDAKFVVQTSDNANILVTTEGHSPYEHIKFETGSEAYKWLNTVIAVGTAQQVAGNIIVDVWQLG